jgi:acyl-ACP thioesterase
VGAAAAPWRFRAADLDLADHVNNAVYWQILEEDLASDGVPEPFDAEIEHRAPGDVGEAAIVRDGHMLWIADGNGEVLASLATPSGP